MLWVKSVARWNRVVVNIPWKDQEWVFIQNVRWRRLSKYTIAGIPMNRNQITPMTAVSPTNPVCQYVARGIDNMKIKSMRPKTVVVMMIIHQRIVLSATMSFASRNGLPTIELGIIATIKHAHLSLSWIQSVSLSLRWIELPGPLVTCPVVGRTIWQLTILHMSKFLRWIKTLLTVDHPT